MDILSLSGMASQVIPAIAGTTSMGALAYIGFKAAQWTFETWFKRSDLREENLSVREARHWTETDAEIADLRSTVAAFGERFNRLERDHDVLLGIVHSMIDDPSPARSIALQLHLAYPLPEDMPPRMRALLARLEAKYGEGIRPTKVII